MSSGVAGSGKAGVWALALHGGADALSGIDYSASEAHMSGLLKQGGEMLAGGASAVSVVRDMARELETCGHYSAGKGASPNQDGGWELDAAIMDGETRKAGSVAALEGIRNPVDAAYAVMEHTPHVMLVGEGAYTLARRYKCKKIKDAKAYYKPAPNSPAPENVAEFGTVGAVALDRDGLLAAATSTGGAPGRMPGRVGDSPLIGAGTWADERVAVSCSGQGEYFIRVGAASDVSARIRYLREGLDKAARATLEDVVFLGGAGGLIAIDCLGRVTMPFTTQGMKRGYIHANGSFQVATF